MSSNRTRSLEILGLPDDASKQEVKKAYLKLSKEFHPDVNKDIDARVRYQQIRDAYDQLQVEGFNSIKTEPNPTQGFKQTPSKEYSQWKMRTEKKKELDDWLKKVQKNAREHKLKMKAMEEKENEIYNRSNPFGENRTDQFVDVKLSRDYLDFEKKFIANLDLFLDKLNANKKASEKNIMEEIRKNSRRPRPTGETERGQIFTLIKLFFPWYGRWILTTAPLVMVGIAATLLGLEVYSSQNPVDFDRCNDPPVGRKTGTLDDL